MEANTLLSAVARLTRSRELDRRSGQARRRSPPYNILASAASASTLAGEGRAAVSHPCLSCRIWSMHRLL